MKHPQVDSETFDAVVEQARRMSSQVDQDLLSRLGTTITDWSGAKEPGWSIESVIATLVDSTAFIIAQYGGGTVGQKRFLLAAAAASLSLTGAEFIDELAKSDDSKEKMN